MSDFGDADPEDAWDPDDAVEELVDNIRRRLVAVLALHVLAAHDEQRLAAVVDDIEHVYARIRARQYEARH